MQEQKEPVIGMMGKGLIYQHIKGHIEELYQVTSLNMACEERLLASCDMLVYCSDTWAPGKLQEVNQRCVQAGVALLPVWTQFEEGVIGPCVIPQQQGCATCAQVRTLGATASEADRKLLRHYLMREREHVTAQPWLSSFSLRLLAVLTREEITTYLREPEELRTACALLSVSLATLECRRHTFLPFPACADCGELARDQAELAMVALQSRAKPDAFTYRMDQPTANPAQILASYVDQRAGLVSTLTLEHTNLLPLASSHLASEGENTNGTGCTLRPEQSKVVSVLEVIERYAGLRPRSKRTTVRTSYRQLYEDGQPVLDPLTLGLHTPEQYEQIRHDHTHRPLVPYHPDVVCNWVWGYSFQRQTPILVPEHCAYYGVPSTPENPAFVFDISNGCALGNCLEEAIFHGMLEVIERDAFLITWYAQLPVPHLDLHSVNDPTARLLVEHLEHQSGYTISAMNITLDHAVPCLCLLGIDETNRENKPKAFVAAGSHPHPEQALLKALREFAMYLAHPRKLDEEGRAQALAMLADSSLVQRMDHHPLLYYLPEAFERLSFLYHSTGQQPFWQAFSDFYQNPPARLDLREDLETLVSYYLKQGQDVIVVDQTAPEHRPCGLRCVKVIMPGLLPMTFGQHNRRITGFPRLHQLPFTLGYQDHPLTVEEINPHPHPFY